MRRVVDVDAVYAAEPGAFAWLAADRDGIAYRVLWFRDPRGSVGCIPVEPLPPGELERWGGHSWTWDGNEDRPTLRPSLLRRGGWHGYVTAGRMQAC
jgi:hypothetical protein